MRRLVHAARPGLRRAFIPANSRVNSSSSNHTPLNKEEAPLPPPPPPPPNAAPDTANHVNELAHGQTRLPQQGSALIHTNSWMNRMLDAVTQSGGPSTSIEGRRQEEAEGVHQTGEVQHISDEKDVSMDEIRAELQPYVHSATSYEPSLDIITSDAPVGHVAPSSDLREVVSVAPTIPSSSSSSSAPSVGFAARTLRNRTGTSAGNAEPLTSPSTSPPVTGVRPFSVPWLPPSDGMDTLQPTSHVSPHPVPGPDATAASDRPGVSHTTPLLAISIGRDVPDSLLTTDTSRPWDEYEDIHATALLDAGRMSDAKQKYVPTQWDELKRLHSERRSKVAIKPSRVTKRARKPREVPKANTFGRVMVRDPETGQLARMILPDADQSSSVEATPIEPIGKATPGWTTEPWREPFEPAVEPSAVVANTRSTNTKPKARPDQLVPAGWMKEEWKDEWAEVSGASVVQSTQTAGKTHGRAASKARRAAAAVRAKRSLDSHHVLGTPRAAPHIHPIEDKRRVTGEIVPSAEPTLSDVVSPSYHKPIATLAHGLDRVLFNPGVHWLQDPRSRVYNFSPRLQAIPKVEDFAFERLQGFVRSSQDSDLSQLAIQEERQYTGSTSSLSGFLSQIYFLISGDREINASNLSQAFAYSSKKFTPGQRMPASILMNWKDGVYALDSGWGGAALSDKTVLTWMGTMLENFLTQDETDFSQLLRSTIVGETGEEPQREAYRYSKSRKFLMRSQLDCVDPRLPGTGVFDIKTRAALPIRMDQMNYEENSGYQIRHQHGILESFEREYFDLIRSAFLKYSMQVRIGNMDGVLVAYHNTAKLFGFQYISLEEMDLALFGAKDVGWPVFDKSVALMEAICDEVAKTWPEKSIRLLIDKRDGENVMKVYALLHDWDGAEDERPIAEFNVYVQSFLDGERHPGGLVVKRCLEQEWTMNYSIVLSGVPAAHSRARVEETRVRQLRAWSLPSGTSIEEMAERFAEIDHGGRKARALALGNEPQPEVEFMAHLFQRPDKGVNVLRALAREGRERENAREELEKGLPKVVWTAPAAAGAATDHRSSPSGEKPPAFGVTAVSAQECVLTDAPSSSLASPELESGADSAKPTS